MPGPSPGLSASTELDPDLLAAWQELCRNLQIQEQLDDCFDDLDRMIDLALDAYERNRLGLAIEGKTPSEATLPLRALVGFAREAGAARERAMWSPRLGRFAEAFRTLGKLCHKINNPLTALMGRTQLLRMKAGTDEGALKAADVIEDSAQRVANDIRDLALLVRRCRDETGDDD
jgi:signal transduction histidine kinase